MTTKTTIEWADVSLNPGIFGCRPKSEGCANCYAARMAHRQVAMGNYPPGITHKTPGGVRWTGKVIVNEDRIVPAFAALPKRGDKRVFVTSMSDLFVDAVPYTFIDAVFQHIALYPQHTFLTLTKYVQRAHHYMTRGCFGGQGQHTSGWPLSNVWFGVTVENQRRADELREYLRPILAVLKFVSYEPALGLVDWAGWEFINWMIYGGMSGPRSQPSHPDWFRATRDWCSEHRIPQFFKQWGAWMPTGGRHNWSWQDIVPGVKNSFVGLDGKLYDDFGPQDMQAVARIGKKKAGRLLDGRTWDEFPRAMTKVEG